MEQQSVHTDIQHAVKAIKQAIYQTRYHVMRSANREALALYYGVGGYFLTSSMRHPN
ncbi:MAG: hypothetical protein ACI3YX_05460 [Prevotella sp.]